MAAQYLDIEDVPESLQKKVHQTLAFRTGNFVWRVKFNTPLNPATVNNTTMYVSNEFNELVKSNIRYDIPNNMIEVTPLEPYTEGLFYFLNITTKVRSKGGQRLKEPVKIKFKL
ncbi:MAG: Ig-like domain-containing protein [Lachnospiraceae bacterium]|nr:Ig-like domain-containing protein [Lachnospiraceae bacterium]